MLQNSDKFMKHADFIIHGRIWTGDKTTPYASSLAVKDDTILYAGDTAGEKEYINENTQVIELGDKFLSPGFTDGHAHITFAEKKVHGGIELHGAADLPGGYEKVLRDYLLSHPDEKFIYGQGFNVTDFGAKGPDTKLLDDIFAGIPVCIESDGCHDMWVNTAMLKKAGIGKDTPEVENGEIVRDENGYPTGFFREDAVSLIFDHFPAADVNSFKKAILTVQDRFLSDGITNVYEPLVCRDTAELKKIAYAYHDLDHEGLLKLKVRAGARLNPEEDVDLFLRKLTQLRQKTACEHFEINGVKLFMDGVVEGRSAYLRDDYSDEPGFKSVPLWQQDKLNEAALKILQKGFHIHVHSMGDAATDMILDAFDYAKRQLKLSDAQFKDLRNAITHLQVVAPDQYKRMGALGIIGVIDTFWHFRTHSYYYSCDLPFLGEERAGTEYPVLSLLKNDVLLSQASDWPVSEPNSPLIGMEIGITRRSPGHPSDEPQAVNEAMTAPDMLDMLTVNGAYQLGIEHDTGTLTTGKKADFIVLDKDPLKTSTYDIHNIKVEKVYIDGKEVYSSSVQST